LTPFLAGAIRRYIDYVVGVARYRYRVFELISSIIAVMSRESW